MHLKHFNLFGSTHAIQSKRCIERDFVGTFKKLTPEYVKFIRFDHLSSVFRRVTLSHEAFSENLCEIHLRKLLCSFVNKALVNQEPARVVRVQFQIPHLLRSLDSAAKHSRFLKELLPLLVPPSSEPQSLLLLALQRVIQPVF